MHLDVKQEIEYATWIAARMSDLAMEAEQYLADRKAAKATLLQKLSENSCPDIECIFCHRQTKKHLDFCEHCGHRNIM